MDSIIFYVEGFELLKNVEINMISIICVGIYDIIFLVINVMWLIVLSFFVFDFLIIMDLKWFLSILFVFLVVFVILCLCNFILLLINWDKGLWYIDHKNLFFYFYCFYYGSDF